MFETIKWKTKTKTVAVLQFKWEVGKLGENERVNNTLLLRCDPKIPN